MNINWNALIPAALPYIGWGIVTAAAIWWLGREWTRLLFESENQPSIRKVGFFLTVLACLRFANVWSEGVINGMLIFASSLVVAGTTKSILGRWSPNPPESTKSDADKDANDSNTTT